VLTNDINDYISYLTSHTINEDNVNLHNPPTRQHT